ncbi:FAD-binding protein [bacterium]|nr:FAD-binding protein [bacterium]
MKNNHYISTDFLIVGSGLAGLRCAIELSRNGYKVAVVTKKKVDFGSSSLAQGGISAVDPEREKNGSDSYEMHFKDTMKAACGISNGELTRKFIESSYDDAIKFMIESEIPFSRSKNSDYPYELHQEGGHSRPRVFCVGDYTGKAIMDSLIKIVENDPNITVYEDHSAIDLITSKNYSEGDLQIQCLGAYIYDKKNDEVLTFETRSVFLATGGAGRIFLFTSNNQVSTGDGIAIAYRAGASISNLEFTQFHPTVLYGYDDNGRSFLLTEALRGKKMGAILCLKKSGPESKIDFVKECGYSPDGSAATRDIVARAIDTEIKQRGITNVFLNVTPEVTGKTVEQIKEGFPQIYKKLKEIGYDITSEPVPVVPAAHYTCGGVNVNSDGQTSGISNLYAIGEVSCTGIMGANRLASNSLSETALFAYWAARHACSNFGKYKKNNDLPLWNKGIATKSRNKNLVGYYWDEIRLLMWHLVGIVRDQERLLMAENRIENIIREIRAYYWNYFITSDFLELRNIARLAQLTVKSALWRCETRGGHYRSDYPEKDEVNFKKNSLV